MIVVERLRWAPGRVLRLAGGGVAARQTGDAPVGGLWVAGGGVPALQTGGAPGGGLCIAGGVVPALQTGGSVLVDELGLPMLKPGVELRLLLLIVDTAGGENCRELLDCDSWLGTRCPCWPPSLKKQVLMRAGFGWMRAVLRFLQPTTSSADVPESDVAVDGGVVS